MNNESINNEAMINLDRFFGGTGSYYKHWMNGVYTDGIKHVAETCGAYWLIDLVFSHRPNLVKKLSLMDFPVKVTLEKWETKNKPNGAKCKIERYDHNGDPIEFTLQTVPYTDFPFNRFQDGKFVFLLGYDVESRKMILSLTQED